MNLIKVVSKKYLKNSLGALQLEDVMQEAFLNIMLNFHKYNKKLSSVKTWSAWKIRSTAKDMIRKELKQIEKDQNIKDKILFSLEDTYFDMSNFSEKEKDICSKVLDGWTNKEIAKLYNIHPATIGRWLLKIKNKLS